ncbi:MAG: tetratricopeptide repeat protein [Ignavibacteria bacterium]|nr:tetratricopeptide repeat protein [Ignavibacteria bacterium]MBT8381703.1 tetratricopeptide repeat protein [Ignavibacteria bacterium]NNJ54416.1 tetratricopeptide repeat protein [Ignavibacteriaceae bacterium]
MRKLISLASFTAAYLLVAAITFSGCSKPEEEGKIEVTTMSSEAEADFKKGRELFEKLRQRESLEYFENAFVKDDKFAMAHYYHSLANPTAKGFFNDLDNAVANAENVSDGERLIILALQAGVDGNQKLQEQHLKKLVELYPNDERAHGQLGQFYFGQQKYKLAIQHLKKSTEIAPDYTASYNMLGYSYRNLGNFDDAEISFRKYIELIPDDPNPYDSYAEMLLKQGRYDESIVQYRKALEVNPDFFASHMGISNNLIYQKKYEQAKENCKNCYDIAKNDGERRFALFTMTVAYVDEGDIDGALEQMQKQFEIAKAINDAGAITADFNTMGNILYEAGKYEEARQKYKDALRVMLESDLSEEVKENTRRLAIYNEGRLQLKTGDLEDAKLLAAEFSTKANNANNTFQIWLSHYLNGLIALEEEEFKTAIRELKSANLQNPQTHYQLALAYLGDGNNEEAKKYAEQCANFNALTSLNQAFVRNEAQQMVASL